jgi:hypothetical protein
MYRTGASVCIGAAIVCVGLFVGLSTRPAQASTPALEIPRALAGLTASQVLNIQRALPSHVALEAVSMIPGVGPAYVDSFSVGCDASELIQPSGGAMISYTCQNSSTTKVAVGDSAIGDPTDAQNSPIYCATNCPSQEFGGNARLEYCRADTGTVTIYCRALVSVTSPP